MPYIGTCFRFYTQMRVQKKTKHLHIEFIVTSHNSEVSNNFLQFVLVTLRAQQMKSVTNWMENVFARMVTMESNANLVNEQS